jgi:DNA-binding Lrp family transcriptional regulator
MTVKSALPQKILAILKEKSKVTPRELESELGVSAVSVHIWLKKLLLSGKIIKQGKAPTVIYSISNDHDNEEFRRFYKKATKNQEFIDKNFLYVLPSGQMIYGMKGFIQWCI